MVTGSNLSWQGIKRKAVYTKGAGMVCKCMTQCTPKGQAWYVNVWGSVHWKGVYRVRDRNLEVQTFFNWFLKLTNQKQPKVTCLVCHLD